MSTRYSKNSSEQPDEELPPLPISQELWLAVAKFLGLNGKLRQSAELILRGMCDRQIESATGISHSTLRTYIDRIGIKTGARGRQAILRLVLAISHQLRD